MSGYIPFIVKSVPRVLTQVDRDKHSKTYGCCDRNFWHLKIRDFSSAILQQTGLAIALLDTVDFEGNIYYKRNEAEAWAKATLYYWKKIQLRDGSYNEYYPNEHGFPPTAFSLFSSCEIYKRLQVYDQNLVEAMRKTGKYLISHIEKKAYNQEIASITALYSLYTITSEKWVLEGLENKLRRILDLQSVEGWFPEYGGADIGYLSVSLDMLAEYYWMSRDERVIEPLNKIIEFIKYFIHPDITVGGEYGSRNTTYFLPNGIEVMVHLGNKDAIAIKKFILQKSNEPGYFMDAVDDRYYSHYLLHSFLRALEKEKMNVKPDNNVGLMPFESKEEKYFPEAGLFVLSCMSKEISSYCIIGTKKGGIIRTFINNQQSISDFGYRVNYGEGNIAVTNWQDNDYSVKKNGNYLEINGKFTKVSLKMPSPILHLGLRVLSFVFGNKIISMLKKKIILVDKHTDITISRRIKWDDEKIIIDDEITSPELIELEAADNFSARHVASGKFYSISDISIHDENNYGKNVLFQIHKEIKLDQINIMSIELKG